MNTDPVITIPRLEGETTRAYAARVEYLTMGAQRSLDKVAKRGQNGGGYRLPSVENWSVKYEWGQHAAAYDQTLATLAAQRHAKQYVADLDRHRAEYQKTGRDLHTLARGMLAQLVKQRMSVEYRASDLATIARALTIAADLEAHALRIADLLPKLSADEPRHE